jgi:hypothetical protein
LVNVGQNEGRPRPTNGTYCGGRIRSAANWPDIPWRKNQEVVVVVVKGQANLLEIVFALSASCRFPRLLNGRKQQGNQDGNNRNHHK